MDTLPDTTTEQAEQPESLPDHVVAYISDALLAADTGEPLPAADGLTETELAAAQQILDDIPPAVDVDIPPLSEDPTAIRLGIVPEPDPVTVDTAAVAAAVAAVDTGTLLDDLSHYLTRRRYRVDSGWLRGVCDGTITEMSPVVIRVLAALVGVDRSHLTGGVDARPATPAGAGVGVDAAGHRDRAEPRSGVGVQRCVLIGDDATFRVVEFLTGGDADTLAVLQTLVDGYVEHVAARVGSAQFAPVDERSTRKAGSGKISERTPISARCSDIERPNWSGRLL